MGIGLNLLSISFFTYAAALHSGAASGLVGIDGPQSATPLHGSPRLILDLRSQGFTRPVSFGLTSGAAKQRSTTLLETLDRELVSRGLLPHGLKLAVPLEQSGFKLANDQEEVSAQIMYGRVPMCEGSIRAVRLRNGSVSVLSTPLPGRGIRTPVNFSFPHLSDAAPLLREYAAEQDKILDEKLGPLMPCWAIVEQEMTPAIWVNLKLERLPYRALVTLNEVTKIEPLYFSAVGKSTVFPNNPKDEAKSIYSLGDLVGNGRLESSAFSTFVNKAQKAEACDHNFSYDTDDVRFAEASAFTNTTRTLAWFSNFLGYQWTDEPLTIRIHEEIGSPPNEKNNALYQPSNATDDARPNILIGDGDGKQLQNLSLDQDVVSHEFGHHIVYRTLKSTVRESLVLHEGLADFFTYARTDDACLGESICPEGSQFCWTSSCLRTAENNLKFTDLKLPTQAHLRSQFISGMLWDLKISQSIAIGDVARIVYKAVDFFASEMVYEQFIDSLVSADKELFDGANCQKILNAATNRGLGARISDRSCEGTGLALSRENQDNALLLEKDFSEVDTKYVLKVSDKLDDAVATTSLCVTKPKVAGTLLTPCGVVGNDGHSSSSTSPWMLMLAPLFWGLYYSRARKKQRA